MLFFNKLWYTYSVRWLIYMENLRRNNKVLVIMLLAFIIVIIALTAAVFSYRKPGTVANKITLGKLELTLTEGNAITLNDTYPMTDDDGKKLTGFTFSLKNTGSTASTYSIYLDDVSVDSGDTRLNDKYIKYSFTKDSVVGAAKPLTDLGTNQQRVLDTGTIAKNTTINYNLKLWVSSDIDADIGGQVWKGKLRIEGEQVH